MWQSLSFLAWFGFVPLLIALEAEMRAAKPRPFRLGYVFGFTFYLIGAYWIALLSDVAITVPWLKYPAWVTAALYLAVFGGLSASLAGWLARKAAVPLAIVAPLAFLVIEELRGSGELGFPWFQPGYTQYGYVPVLQMASLGSVTLVTAWLYVLNVLVWRTLVGGARVRSAFGALLLFALPWVWGQRVIDAAPREPGPLVALVQGNIPGEMKWSGRHQPEILDRFVSLTERAAQGEKPIVTIWPETATGSYLTKQLDQSYVVRALAHRTGVPVFSGYPDYAYGPDGKPRYYNAAGMFVADGSSVGPYAKRHLVPFGERMPFQWLIPAFGKIELGQAEWTPGKEAVLFPSPAGPFTCLVCFESIFPDPSREDVRKGARWLVNITNDEWFGNSAALRQHAAMAVFRAVENHVPLARCANTGLTMVIDAYGRVRDRLPVFETDVLRATLGVPSWRTPYTQVGDWPGVVAIAGIAVLVALAWRRARRERVERAAN